MNWFQALLVIVLPVLFQFIVLGGLSLRVDGDMDYFWGYSMMLIVMPTAVILIPTVLLQKLMWEQSFYKAITIDMCLSVIPFVIYFIMLYVAVKYN